MTFTRLAGHLLVAIGLSIKPACLSAGHIWYNIFLSNH